MSNRKWNLGLLLLFAVFACLLLQFVLSTLRIGELVRPLEPGPPDGQRPRRIVLIPQELDNPYWRSIEQGAREAARKYGMELSYAGPFRIDPAEQSRLLEKAIAAKADAILLQGIGDPQYRELIDKASGRGIPVIAVDTDEPGSRRLAYVGTDNTEAGKRMGELVTQASGGAGTIGVLIGSEAANQRLRLEGFRSVVGRYPKLAIAEVRSSNISRLQAAEQAAAMLHGHPQIGYLVGFSALDGPGMLEAAGRVRPEGLRIFAFDDLPETTEGVRQCRIASSIVQQPRQMGYDAVALLHGYFQGKTPQTKRYTDTSVLDLSALGIGGSCP